MEYMLVVNFGDTGKRLFLGSIRDMFASVKYDIDDERAEFTRSLAW
jgi:hypothetical protein